MFVTQNEFNPLGFGFERMTNDQTALISKRKKGNKTNVQNIIVSTSPNQRFVYELLEAVNLMPVFQNLPVGINENDKRH